MKPFAVALEQPVALPHHAVPAVARQAGRFDRAGSRLPEQSACRRFRDELRFLGKLFLNVSPESSLGAAHQSGRTLQMLQDFGIPPSGGDRTHRTNTDRQLPVAQTALHHYRAMGFSIALITGAAIRV